MTAPRLRSDLSFIEQRHGGETTWVVKDLVARRYFRFGQAEVRVMQEFDGVRTPQEIADALVAHDVRFSALAIEEFARTLADVGFLDGVAGRTPPRPEGPGAERHGVAGCFAVSSSACAGRSATRTHG